MIDLDFDKSPDKLIPAIAQDWQTGEILMLGYVNQKAFEAARATGLATYWSRSRQELWVKGKTSGHLQRLHDILVDCDNDTIIYKVEQVGGIACQLGTRSCFSRRVSKDTLVAVDPIASDDPS